MWNSQLTLQFGIIIQIPYDGDHIFIRISIVQLCHFLLIHIITKELLNLLFIHFGSIWFISHTLISILFLRLGNTITIIIILIILLPYFQILVLPKFIFYKWILRVSTLTTSHSYFIYIILLFNISIYIHQLNQNGSIYSLSLECSIYTSIILEYNLSNLIYRTFWWYRMIQLYMIMT